MILIYHERTKTEKRETIKQKAFHIFGGVDFSAKGTKKAICYDDNVAAASAYIVNINNEIKIENKMRPI